MHKCLQTFLVVSTLDNVTDDMNVASDEKEDTSLLYCSELFAFFSSRSRWGCQITDRGLYQLSTARCISNLSSLSLWGTTGITDTGVVQLVCYPRVHFICGSYWSPKLIYNGHLSITYIFLKIALESSVLLPLPIFYEARYIAICNNEVFPALYFW